MTTPPTDEEMVRMGYAAILGLDDTAARTGDTDALGAALIAVLGDDPYPSGGIEARQVGPWQLAAAMYSHAAGVFTLSAEGLTRCGTEHAFDGSIGWHGQMTAGEAGRLTRELLAHPHRLAAAVATAGGDLQAAVWGHGRTDSVASAWWVYLDALRGPVPPAAALGAWIRRQIDRPMDASLADDPGPWGQTLNRAGAVVAGGEATVIWSGNRLCGADQLGDDEVQQLRGARVR